ncbi:low density lipoprotein receptor adapter protein 1-like [Liolophura sinensis]|uniref:low density lipoprotein receptor adapter protein 1-like n=1 Tax=Liolophura sinensis TaxID=3198878 RepID=UPI003158C75E
MESLLKAVRRSPNVLRDPFGKSRHKKLPEGWGENNGAISDGMTFYLKHLGSTLVEELPEGDSYGDGISSKAVASIVSMAKAAGKKLKKVAITVSPKGIKVVDLITKEVSVEVSIYRISFCTADRNHDKVFAFIARNTINETMECHAYLCAKAKIAQAVTLTVSQSFNVANEIWQKHEAKKKQKERENQEKKCTSDKRVSSPVQMHMVLVDADIHGPNNPSSNSPCAISTDSVSSSSSGGNLNNFEDEDSSLDDDFSRLAADRSKQDQTFFRTDLRQADVDESVHQYINEEKCYEAFTRQKSVEDLLSL